jgi:hypothetical protein
MSNNDNNNDNIVNVNFKPHTRKELAALYHDLEAVVYKHTGQVTFAGVIGVLEMLKHTVLHTEIQDDA